MSIEIRQAITDAERERVARFWYEIYVDEMKYVQTHADHSARMIVEPLDQFSITLTAFEGAEVVGTMRASHGRDGDLGYYIDFYDMRRFERFFPNHCSITTKFMVAQKYRNTALALRLAREVYSLGIRRGIQFDFVECDTMQKRFNERVGYRQVGEIVQHPEYGSVCPMVLVVQDLDHLTAVKSPMARLCEKEKEDSGAVEFFYKKIVPGVAAGTRAKV